MNGNKDISEKDLEQESLSSNNVPVSTELSLYQDNIQGETSAILDHTNVLALRESQESLVGMRIHFVRHYPYKNSPDEIERYNGLIRKIHLRSTLTDSEGLILKDLSRNLEVYEQLDQCPIQTREMLERIFSDPEHTFIIFDPVERRGINQTANGADRVPITARDLSRHFKIPENNKGYVTLPPCSKDDFLGEVYQKTAENFGGIFTKIKEVIATRSDITNFVIISNRSYAHAFDISMRVNRKMGIENSERTFEEQGYLLADFKKVGKEAKLENTNPNMYIQVIPRNYLVLQERIKGIIPDIESNSLLEFQNMLMIQINEVFRRDPITEGLALLLKLLDSDQPDLQSFALRKLLENMQFELLENHYLTFHDIEKEKGYTKRELKSISDDEKRILIDHFEQLSPVRRIVATLFALQNWSDKLVEDAHLLQRLKVYKKAVEIQTRSLDRDIKEQKKNAILDQDYRINAGESKQDTLDLLESDESYFLSAMVGWGKSLWITEFVKKLTLEQSQKNVIFFEGSNLLRELGNKNENESWNEFFQRTLEDKLKGDNVILILDAFDEIKLDISQRNKLHHLLYDRFQTIKKVISGRPSEFGSYDVFENSIHLEGIDSDEFIAKKADDKKEELGKLISSASLSDTIQQNPLLLFFICVLANVNPHAYKYLDIKPLSQILEDEETIRTHLYENILKLIIARHDDDKPHKSRWFSENTAENKNILNDVFDYLSQLAIGLSKRQSYDEIKQSHHWKKIPHDAMFDAISLLFKREESGDYQFAHDSFRDYFLYSNRKQSSLENWQKLLLNLGDKGDISSLLLFNDRREFSEDAEFLLKMGNETSDWENQFIASVCKAISDDALDEKVYLLEMINIDSPVFHDNFHAIKYFCKAISRTTAIYHKSFLFSQTGLSKRLVELLQRINVNWESFRVNPEAIEYLCKSLSHIASDRRSAYEHSSSLTNLLENIWSDKGIYLDGSFTIKYYCDTVARLYENDFKTKQKGLWGLYLLNKVDITNSLMYLTPEPAYNAYLEAIENVYENYFDGDVKDLRIYLTMLLKHNIVRVKSENPEISLLQAFNQIKKAPEWENILGAQDPISKAVFDELDLLICDNE